MSTQQEVSLSDISDRVIDSDPLITELEIYWHRQWSAPQDLMSRLGSIIPLFLGRPYQWEALGEGSSGRYSQDPLYRFDAFDCVTFVNTVLALIYSNGITAFKKNLQAIRYSAGEVDYRLRTDWFTDLEWNPRAQELGWLQDVTPTFKDANQQPLFTVAKTVIDKPGWYAARSLEDLHVPLGPAEKTARLIALQAEGRAFSSKESQLPYIPLHSCFSGNKRNKQPIASFWAQMPGACVIEIVRPDWPIKTTWIDPQGRARGYGTNLNVSHLGFALKDPKTEKFTFYHASRLENKKVMSIDLFDYLVPYCHHDTIKGIHVEAIQPAVKVDS